MAREKRFFQQGETYFISHHGLNGRDCFFDDACYRFYLTRLINGLKTYQVKLHAFVLLPGRLMLLVTPLTPTGISGLIRSAGDAYVDYYNNRFNRSGPLWSGRFNSFLVKGDWFALDCQKYIELAPVLENLVSRPGAHHWSSFYINGFGGHGTFLTPHAQYQAFGKGARNRFQHYRNFIERSFKPHQLKLFEHRLRGVYARVTAITSSATGQVSRTQDLPFAAANTTGEAVY